MCGIAGELAFGGVRAGVEPVRKMTAAMESRGPDGQGIWREGWVALGHRRLSIIDLSDGGAQPMVDEDLGLPLCLTAASTTTTNFGASLPRTTASAPPAIRK